MEQLQWALAQGEAPLLDVADNVKTMALVEAGYRSLEENQRVEFDVAQGPKGLQAENIRPL